VLTPEKFDYCFPALESADNRRQGTQYLRNQALIVRVANSNPQDRRTNVTRCAEKRKIAILRD
jgi:hypothetical protein